MPSPCSQCPSFVSATPLALSRGGLPPTLSARRPRHMLSPTCVAAAPQRRAALPLPEPSAAYSAGVALDVCSVSEFVSLQATAAARERVVYVLFHAGYCRACKAVVPKFRALAAEYPSACFLTVRLEEGRELAGRLGVRAVPTVHIYRGSHGKIDDFPCGPASVPRFRDTVHELSAPADAGGAGCAPAPVEQ